MKTAISVALGIGSFVASILVMILGWGLEPQSWGWIIFGGIFAVILLGASQAIGDL